PSSPSGDSPSGLGSASGGGSGAGAPGPPGSEPPPSVSSPSISSSSPPPPSQRPARTWAISHPPSTGTTASSVDDVTLIDATTNNSTAPGLSMNHQPFRQDVTTTSRHRPMRTP